MACTGCGQQCRLDAHAGSNDGKRWYCGTCNMRKSLRDGSFFSRIHLSLKTISTDILLVLRHAADNDQT